MTDFLCPEKGNNRHPVDQLHDVRADMKEDKEREEALKRAIMKMMGDRDSLGGDECIAHQDIRERKGSLDEARIAKALGVENLDRFRKPSTTYIVLSVHEREEALG